MDFIIIFCVVEKMSSLDILVLGRVKGIGIISCLLCITIVFISISVVYYYLSPYVDHFKWLYLHQSKVSKWLILVKYK